MQTQHLNYKLKTSISQNSYEHLQTQHLTFTECVWFRTNSQLQFYRIRMASLKPKMKQNSYGPYTNSNPKFYRIRMGPLQTQNQNFTEFVSAHTNSTYQFYGIRMGAYKLKTKILQNSYGPIVHTNSKFENKNLY